MMTKGVDIFLLFLAWCWKALYSDMSEIHSHQALVPLANEIIVHDCLLLLDVQRHRSWDFAQDLER